MPSIAIVGASSDRTRFANKAVRAFAKRGWTVHPVHPKETSVEGRPAFASVKDVPGPLDAVSLYVPPKVGLGLLDEIAALEPKQLFVNPGADSDELVARAEELGLNAIVGCSIIGVGENPGAY